MGVEEGRRTTRERGEGRSPATARWWPAAAARLTAWLLSVFCYCPDVRFRLLVEGVKDYAILLLDPCGIVRTWNCGAERIKGYAGHEIVGRHFSAFYTERDRASGRPAAALRAAARDGRYEEEGLRVRKDGTTFWANVIITPLYDGSGRLAWFGKVTRDLTDRKRADEEKTRLTELLHLRVEAMEAFNNAVAHDLNAPLRSMEGFAQALSEDYADCGDARLLDYARRIAAAAGRMRELVRDMMRLGRLTSAEPDKAFRTFSLSDMAAELVAVERTYPENQKHDVRVQPGMTACGDQDLVRLLLQNLIANAFKFSSKKDSPFVTVGSQGGEFYVADNGIGFEQGQADRLFKPFSRLHDARDYPGTGIGLTIAKRVVEVHDGFIRAYGQPGEGAAFFFTLAGQEDCGRAEDQRAAAG